jgi:hypothetical protein
MADEREQLSLAKAVANLLEECRTVVPGIQGLFGFQLIAVFNEFFHEKLAPQERLAHLAAIVLVVISLVLIMTPAAYHRITGPREASAHFIVLSTRMLLGSMAALALAICVDTWLVARLITGARSATTLGLALLLLFGALWYLLPIAGRARRRREEQVLAARERGGSGSP